MKDDFYFHRSEMLKHVRTEILSAIHLWDNIVEWEQSLMGIDKCMLTSSITTSLLSRRRERICGHPITE